MDLSGWASPEWWDNHRLSQEWLRREFGGEKADMYEPVLEELELDEPIQEDLEAVGQRASGLSAGSVGHSPPQSRPNGIGWFEMVPAPLASLALEGERRPSTSSSPFIDVEAMWKAYEEGQLQD